MMGKYFDDAHALWGSQLLGQHVEVRVTGVDAVRGRIALSMRREA